MPKIGGMLRHSAIGVEERRKTSIELAIRNIINQQLVQHAAKMNIPSSSLHTPFRRSAIPCIRQTQRSTRIPFRHSQQQQRRHVSAGGPSPVARFTVNPQRRAGAQDPTNPVQRYHRSIALCAAGIVASAIGMYAIINTSGLEKNAQSDKKDGQSSSSSDRGYDRGKIIKLEGPPGLGDNQTTTIIDGIEQIPTENSTIPTFPKTIRLPVDAPQALPSGGRAGDDFPPNTKTEEYTLLGLGIRSVSFLSIQVYVVGLYIANSDIAALQQHLIKQAATPVTSSAVNGNAVVATSLVPGEREALKQMLLDPEQGQEVWNDILRDTGVRTALRIVPTRNTDLLHLRDGWVRAITAQAQSANARAQDVAAKQGSAIPAGAVVTSEFEDDSFGTSLNDFKSLFGGGARKNVPKGQILYLLRNKVGGLETMLDLENGKPMVWLGSMQDERVSRLLWMAYLAGKKVASEGARNSVVDGVMGIVGRPVGTVEQRVA
ncbi:hypothetical protein BDDG_03109 [Blastomyces dermatitidis ATCC 18188]|uniref:Chalcone isomerase domain-containing protein n=1 Tax=Ajellomyces dermatitidis (strain ATCC 18188 / CBS 674.68) TaxID=653446 RepID=F2TAA5_AJEDA|nr:hypothetical protein BDDG_03109 [Blastomyces dermatitidis ATCC 18188]